MKKLFIIIVFVLIPLGVRADYIFSPIGNFKDNEIAKSIGEKISLAVYNDINGNINFKLANNIFGFGNNFINEIYLYDYAKINLSWKSFSYIGEVKYTQPDTKPSFLPGFNDHSPKWKAESTTEGAKKNGIDVGESLIITFTGTNLQNILTAFDKGDLIFGIHVKGIEGISCGGSCSLSYIQTSNNGAYPTSIPGTLPLLATGFFGFSLYIKRRLKD